MRKVGIYWWKSYVFGCSVLLGGNLKCALKVKLKIIQVQNSFWKKYFVYWLLGKVWVPRYFLVSAITHRSILFFRGDEASERPSLWDCPTHLTSDLVAVGWQITKHTSTIKGEQQCKLQPQTWHQVAFLVFAAAWPLSVLVEVTEVLFPPTSERWSGEKGSERKSGQNGVTKFFLWRSGSAALPQHGWGRRCVLRETRRLVSHVLLVASPEWILWGAVPGVPETRGATVQSGWSGIDGGCSRHCCLPAALLPYKAAQLPWASQHGRPLKKENQYNKLSLLVSFPSKIQESCS